MPTIGDVFMYIRHETITRPGCPPPGSSSYSNASLFSPWLLSSLIELGERGRRRRPTDLLPVRKFASKPKVLVKLSETRWTQSLETITCAPASMSLSLSNRWVKDLAGRVTRDDKPALICGLDNLRWPASRSQRAQRAVLAKVLTALLR